MKKDWDVAPNTYALDVVQISGGNFGAKIHKDREHRKWSASILLNDDFSHGVFRFHNPDGSLDKCHMDPGDMIHFQANQYHSVEPTDGRMRIAMQIWITNGEKKSNE